jgi:CheY-like chemotaxis protein/HPt (histidine-containing phosphotransfer) domain-containing protein
MLTSVGLTLSPEEQSELGIDAHLTKPLRAPELRRALLRAIGGEAPLERDNPKRAERASSARAALGVRVLLAEDNPVNQEVATMMLASLGCDFVVVASGQRAIDAVARERFDLVLMDCQMPEVDGLEATARIRAQEAESAESGRARHIPIIALTANAMEGDRERCLQAGMDDYLGKPFSREELARAIERWIDSGSASSSATGTAPVPASGEAPSAQSVLDGNALDQLAALPGAVESGIVARIIDTYLSSSDELWSQIEEAARSRDAEAMGRAVHRLKSSSAQLGGMQLAKLCAEVEATARSGEDAPAEQIAAIGSALGLVRAELRLRRAQAS